MDDWENFSAFGDIGELEHVAYLLEECAAGELSPGCLDDLAGDDSYLLKRLNIQAAGTARLLEAKRPGLYERTWIAGIFGALFNELHDVVGKPRRLPVCLPSIVLNMHKVFIAAHDVFNPFHLERMISEAEYNGRETAISSHMRNIAKGPRNRSASHYGGRALVACVRAESKKRQWNTAWSWLCTQAENKASVGAFALDGVCDSGNFVRYLNTQEGAVKSIKKSTFQDYWQRPNRSKKVGR